MGIIKIVIYSLSSGKSPYTDWRDSLDIKTRSIIVARITRIRFGNFGDCKVIKDGAGIWELRVDYGPGYRIYFGKKRMMKVVILIGVDKGSQNRDIAKAKRYWLQAKELLDE